MKEEIKTATREEPKKENGFRKFMRGIAVFLFVIILLGALAKYLLGAILVYSEGDRVGYVYKFSHKGYVFKTDEGILKTGFVNIGNTTTPNEEWAFSVDNDSIAKLISSIDQRIAVKLYYKEYYTRLFFKGDTKYFVYKMELMPQR